MLQNSALQLFEHMFDFLLNSLDLSELTDLLLCEKSLRFAVLKI